ncbi:MAG: hypothetical protein LBS72_01330 [Oscillospiraceae bacterium]|jgi:hypothetical protein|nr:hypothetical protein [Oscillospiraceae bacterium]
MAMNDDFPCIDFDEAFQKFAHAWMRENSAKYGGDMDKLEARLQDVYLRWLNRPARWLDGQKPSEYFLKYNDPNKLIEWLREYDVQHVRVPDLLLERIPALPNAEDALMRALEEVSTPYTVRLMIVSMLREIESAKPMALYIEWIAKRISPRDELADMAAESLEAIGAIVMEPIFTALPRSNPAGQETFLDVLTMLPFDERTYELAVNMFETRTERTALYASYLGKLGDPRALLYLEKAVNERNLNYLDFIEVRNAIEELGGDAPSASDFAGDPFYEMMRAMEGDMG